MRYLFVGTAADENYLWRFKNILGNVHFCAPILVCPETLSALALAVSKHKFDGIFCANQRLLKMLLDATPDYRAPATRKEITLDDYAGSLLYLTNSKFLPEQRIPVVILNPLSHLVETSSGAFLFKRYANKLTQPDQFFTQSRFAWEVASPGTIDSFYDRFRNAIAIAVDIETEAKYHTIECVTYCAIFPDFSTSSVVLPIREQPKDAENILYWLTWAARFNTLPAPKIFQNGQYDNAYFFRWGIPVFNYLWDTQHLFHSWYSELPKRLDFITSFTLREIRYWKDDGKGGNLFDYYRYNAMDGWATANTFLALMQEMPDWAIQNYLIEFPLVFPCLRAGMEGLRVDKEKWDEIVPEKQQDLERLLTELRKLVGLSNFNPSSSQQVVRLLKGLGSGDLNSSDKRHLSLAIKRSPVNSRIFSAILRYKETRKLYSSYLQESKLAQGRDGALRLLYALNPAGTDTARLASKESFFWCGYQIQNVPRGDSVKAAYTSDPEYLFGSVDYSQSESRCTGYISGDTNLIATVESPRDFHAINIELFFGIAYDNVMVWDPEKEDWKCIDKPIRDLSKRVNHGANYNMGAGVLEQTMGPDNVEKARQLLRLPSSWTHKQICVYLLNCFEKAYPIVKGDWYDWIKATVERTHMLVSALGWTRWFFGRPALNKQDLNAAIAHGPQNLSVGIINRCFHGIWRDIQNTEPEQWHSGKWVRERWDTAKDKSRFQEILYTAKKEALACSRSPLRIKAQIHDELFFQYHQSCPTMPHLIQNLMDCPIEVTDIKGVTRVMRIPPALSYGATHWNKLK